MTFIIIVHENAYACNYSFETFNCVGLVASISIEHKRIKFDLITQLSSRPCSARSFGEHNMGPERIRQNDSTWPFLFRKPRLRSNKPPTLQRPHWIHISGCLTTAASSVFFTFFTRFWIVLVLKDFSIFKTSRKLNDKPQTDSAAKINPVFCPQILDKLASALYGWQKSNHENP